MDPTSDLGEEIDEENAPTCAVCGEPIVHSPTHRVVTWVADDRVQTRHFCSDPCREEWQAPPESKRG